MEPQGKKQIMGQPVPKELHRKFKAEAANRGVSMGDAVKDAVEGWLMRSTTQAIPPSEGSSEDLKRVIPLKYVLTNSCDSEKVIPINPGAFDAVELFLSLWRDGGPDTRALIEQALRVLKGTYGKPGNSVDSGGEKRSGRLAKK